MKKYLFYTFISSFFSFSLIFLLVYPRVQNLFFLKKEILEKESDLQSEEEYFQEIEKTSEELKKYQDSLLKIDSALPKKFSLPELLNFLQKVTSQSGLSLKGISSVSATPLLAGKIKENRLNLVLVGNYSDFRNFLSILENSARLIEVENISFSLPKEGQTNFNLTIKVYSY